tara:strand:- start:1158 stop:1544 length:387 start_codon:yes stop_codon:yes gene_type:complete
MNSNLPILPMEIINKILYKHKGLIHPTAIIMNKAIKDSKEYFFNEPNREGDKVELWNKAVNHELEEYHAAEETEEDEARDAEYFHMAFRWMLILTDNIKDGYIEKLNEFTYNLDMENIALGIWKNNYC